MYEEHFGLRSRPFCETRASAACIKLPSRDTAQRRLQYAIDRGPGCALLTGPPGTGKSLLGATVAPACAGVTVHLPFPALPAASLLRFLAAELGDPSESSAEPAFALRSIRTSLEAMARVERRPLLLVDDAHCLRDPAAFDALLMLLNFASVGPPDLAILLIGTTELLDLLPSGLADRVGSACTLAPFSEGETLLYLRGKLRAAGGDENLFSREVIAALHEAASGSARRLNRLADLCLLIAFAREQPRPDLETVVLAAEEAGFEPACV